ncbi:MAG: succinylglutamate desuccinylase/aspartoacylase family protein [bacterium]
MSIFTLFKPAPRFQVWHSHPGSKSQVLITAGVDGDEYASIAAAKQLIEQFSTHPPIIPITIIPIVNLAGNKAGVSHNPLDGRFPKTIFPGSPLGTSSSRLMFKLSKYTKGIKLWIDLHGGAHDEELNPFIWADKTGNNQVDILTSYLLSSLKATSLYSHNTLTPSLPLSKRKASYLLIECGQLGQTTPPMVNQHISWVNDCIKVLSNQPYNPILAFTPTYSFINYHIGSSPNPHPNNLLWTSPLSHATAS